MMCCYFIYAGKLTWIDKRKCVQHLLLLLSDVFKYLSDHGGLENIYGSFMLEYLLANSILFALVHQAACLM